MSTVNYLGFALIAINTIANVVTSVKKVQSNNQNYFSSLNSVIFNLGSAEPKGSTNSLLGYMKILKSASF